jgi:hypothetical protein
MLDYDWSAFLGFSFHFVEGGGGVVVSRLENENYDTIICLFLFLRSLGYEISEIGSISYVCYIFFLNLISINGDILYLLAENMLYILCFR